MNGKTDYAIQIQGISKKYRLENKAEKQFEALSDISVNIKPGEVVGIIGNNGSGKSTLLKVLSGVIKPTGGRVIFYGSVTSILDIGANFNPDLTGRENIRLNLRIAQIPQNNIVATEQQIHAFSEIGDFFNEPVKTYSSGMFLRLAFSMAFHLSSDILLLDEVLSVGDEGFRLKCYDMLKELTARGKTILFVSHNRSEILDLSTRCIWIANGTVYKDGDPAPLMSEYFARHRENYEEKKNVINNLDAVNNYGDELNGTLNMHWPQNEAPGNQVMGIRALTVKPADGTDKLTPAKAIEISFTIEKRLSGVEIGAFFFLQDVFYQPVMVGHFLNNTTGNNFARQLKNETGIIDITCTLPANFLAPGKYYLLPRFGIERNEWNDRSEEAFRFSEELHFVIYPDTSYTDIVGDISKGSVRPALNWQMQISKGTV